MTLLQVENLHIATADGRPIVSGVTLAVPAGRTVGIVGQSGSGKSMLCKAVLGILPDGVGITEGRIRFDGIDLATLDFAAWRRVRGPRIAAIFQDPASYLNPSIPVGRQLAEVFRVHRRMGRSAARQAALELFATIRLRDPESVYGRYSFELSGGMLQRIAIAAAIATNPELLIADEATTALDVTVQADILDLLTELRTKLNLGLLFISHDLAVIAQVSDHIVVMHDGVLVEEGSPRQVLFEPRHPFTRSLVDNHERYSIERLLAPEGADG